MAPTKFADLPPELLLQITDHLKEAAPIARLGRTSKAFQRVVDEEAWKSFSRHQFPTICPQDSPSFRETARTLTTLSRALDKRAFLATGVSPSGDICAFPGRRRIEKWKRPRGQTLGFTPLIAVQEEVGPRWCDREETLAFSAGAEVCLRQTTRATNSEPSSRWTTYRPLSAYEGRDDVTSLHLVRPIVPKANTHDIITGTANGDLQLTCLPRAGSLTDDVKITYFTTQGKPVRSSSLLQEHFQPTLLAASLGESSIALYQVDGQHAKIAPSSQIDLKPALRPDGHPLSQRIWSTKFLSTSMLAAGVGPSATPVQIFSIAESGITRDPLRKFALKNDISRLDNVTLSGTPKPPMSSVYTIEPLPASSESGNVFLSGAYDGIVRLHDMRSNNEIEKRFIDPSDDSPIYSILPRGQEKIVVGTGRHNLLKVFDLRIGKCYYSPAVSQDASKDCPSDNFSVYLRAKASSGGNSWNRNRSRPTESSVYSLASSSSASPYIYAGLENAIMSLALTETLDRHPDPAFFKPWDSHHGKVRSGVFNEKEILDLAMHDQGSMSLYQQRSPSETFKARDLGRVTMGGLDGRWRNSADVD